MHLLLAASWLDPIVNGLLWIVTQIDVPVRNYGVSLIILAVLLRAVFWPLNAKQFQSMIGMQKIAPTLKKLQTKFKEDPQKLQQETMRVYKESGVNPLAGCWPMLVQYPFLISVFYMVYNHKTLFVGQHFLWIGSALSQHFPQLFATQLSEPDIPLLLLYAVSMYLSVRFGSMPATDPQQAQTQKMMSFMSPIMLGFLGWKYHWPSAIVLYWFASNALQMAQQIYMMRRFHEPLSFIDSAHVITEDVPAETPAPAKKTTANGARKAKKKTKGA